MFGVICAGRPVQTNLQQVDEGKYVFQINDGAKVKHMVVFLLPEAVIPPDMAASVYFQLPGKDFELLGAIAESKPSAIFRINGGSNAAAVGQELDQMVDEDAPVQQYDINVGISIEPAAKVEGDLNNKNMSKLVQSQDSATNAIGVEKLANKIVSHAYNYLTSFATADNMVPIKAFDDWWDKFKKKLGANPKFLDNMN